MDCYSLTLGHAVEPTEDENTFYRFGWSDHAATIIAHSVDGYGDPVDRVCGLEQRAVNRHAESVRQDGKIE